MTTATGENPLIDQAIGKLNEIERQVEELFNKVNDVMSWVPGFLSDLIEPVRKAMDDLNKKMAEFWTACKHFATDRGNPGRLKAAAAMWSDAIGNPIGDIAGAISIDKLKTEIEWQGRAAEAYKTTVPAQISGLNSLKDLGLQIRNSLVALANGIDSFWTQIIGIVAGLLIAFGIAIVSACTVVGIPAAIVILLGALGASIAGIFATISAVDSLTGTVASEQQAILDKVNALGSTWSVSDTGAMSNSSDWRVQ
ncbi:hypothetical protein QRX50_43350 [Amycolatopsis carbonis]|uniref:Uncharacterized protein n=1 Tax=Amycolatopsis carbonis TaxID=715471 RepID=A0A9Y2IDY5_9PSEU|nr:hypothetical protein [Amycolatopsis sp. 2-15]WIX78149.1 hypothetical protein QRX50_43350 [Amycolatopsis sp. 2-15]